MNNSKKVVIDFCAKQVSKTTQVLPVEFQLNNAASELERFRKQLQLEGNSLAAQLMHLYTRRTMIYRGVFFALSLIFSMLAATTLVLTSPDPAHLLYFLFGTAPKYALFFLCLMLSIGTAVIALNLRTEDEVLREMARRARHDAKRMHSKAKFQDIREKIQREKEATLHLLRRIDQSKERSSGERWQLFIQSLDEYNQNLKRLL